MAIYTANFEEDDKILSIEASNFLTRDNYINIKDNLKCPTLNCNCQLVFVNKTPNPYFRKHPNSNHNENCPYYIGISGSRSRILTSEHVSSTLSDQYIEEKLKRATKKFIDSLNGKTPNKNTKSKTRKKVDYRKASDDTPSVNVVSKGENLLDQQGSKLRKPSIREINFNNIEEAPTDRVISYTGELEVIFDDKNNKFKMFSPLKGKNSKLEVILNEAYFTSAQIVNFRNILDTLLHIIKSRDNFYFISLGDLIKKENNYEFYISDYTWFYIFTDINGKLYRAKPDTMLNIINRKK